MILDIVEGDILRKDNDADVIIGMNTMLEEVFGIGLRFAWQIQHNKPIPLGTVFSFKLDKMRKLHMIICHDLGENGWVSADKYLRFGMDYLWHSEAVRKFSMVKVGTGRVGNRDGADVASIMSAIASSHLPVTMYIHDPIETIAVEARAEVPLHTLFAYRSWNPVGGEHVLAA